MEDLQQRARIYNVATLAAGIFVHLIVCRVVLSIAGFLVRIFLISVEGLAEQMRGLFVSTNEPTYRITSSIRITNIGRTRMFILPCKGLIGRSMMRKGLVAIRSSSQPRKATR